jgi:hypothetical protein
MIVELIEFAILVGIVVLVILIIDKLIRKAVKSKKLPGDAVNGITLIIRFIGVFIIIIDFFVLIKVESEVLISVSSITGIIIGFASTEVMGEFIAGIYLLSSRPFGIHDLVQLDETEGVVKEIGLNYTKLQKFDGSIVKIPNKKVIDSQIVNYTIKISDEVSKRLAEMNCENITIVSNQVNPLANETVLEEKRGRFKKIDLRKMEWSKVREVFGEFSQFVFETEITRYTFDLEVDMGIDAKEAIKKLEKVCSNYAPVYKYRPVFRIMGIGWRATYRFRVYSPDPQVIINHQSNFVADVINALYGEKESEEKAIK